MMSRLRAVLLLGFWFTSIAVFAPIMIGLCLLTGRESFIYTPVRWFIRTGLALVGVKVIVDGIDRLEKSQTYVFTPNHQSLIEVPLLITFLRHNVAYLAKKELFKYPIFGFGLKVIGAVPVDRGNQTSAVESARRATKKLREGKSYVVYPEGTRSPDGKLQQFKKGAFRMAVEAGVPVVPITISGSTAIMPKGELRVSPATVRMTIHDPIPTSGKTLENVDDLLEATRERILSELVEEH
ncbi:MAG TPA: lysophospholipid acyltransferase family protein [Blastocatellia bacterium]|nr:lysophospholipid acyltransferase family protein [Blastocatellia bacterium]